MSAAVGLYRERIPVLCDCLKVATESWLQALWKQQYNTMHNYDTECDCNTVAANDEKQTQWYLPADCTAAGYVGMDECVVCTDRYEEQLTLTRDSALQSDPKYAFMSRHGGSGSWIYIPYIFSSLHVKK